MRIIKDEVLFSTKWLVMKKARFKGRVNNEIEWEYVSRIHNIKVVTVICQDQDGKYLLIEQPRAPVASNVISFPAGLVDEGESYEVAALRELKEETGFVGEVVEVTGPFPKSAGLTDEASSVVLVKVDSSQSPESDMEETEDITCFWSTPEEFLQNVDERGNGVMISLDLFMFMKGCVIGDRL